MSSIHNPIGAVQALRSLNAARSGIAETTRTLATGQRHAGADQSPVHWALSRTLDAEAVGLRSRAASMVMVQGAVSAARMAAEAISTLLGDMRAVIVAAQDGTSDRQRLQSRIGDLTDQIAGLVESASFHGVNLLKTIDAPTPSHEGVILGGQDLSFDPADPGTLSGVPSLLAQVQDRGNRPVVLDANTVQPDTGDLMTLTLSLAIQGNGNTKGPKALGQSGQSFTTTLSHVVAQGQTIADVVAAFSDQWPQHAATLGSSAPALQLVANGGQLTASAAGLQGNDTITLGLSQAAGAADAGPEGGLVLLRRINVSTKTGAAAALSAVEIALGRAVVAAGTLGNNARHLEGQQRFLRRMNDSLLGGRNAIQSVDFAETLARKRAFEVQKALAAQSLSIANAAPAYLLPLLRQDA